MVLSFMSHTRGKSDFKFLQIDTEKRTYQCDLMTWDTIIPKTTLGKFKEKCIMDGYTELYIKKEMG